MQKFLLNVNYELSIWDLILIRHSSLPSIPSSFNPCRVSLIYMEHYSNYVLSNYLVLCQHLFMHFCELSSFVKRTIEILLEGVLILFRCPKNPLPIIIQKCMPSERIKIGIFMWFYLYQVQSLLISLKVF